MSDPQFWWGLFLGTIFSIPAGVVAIFLASRVASYLERRKLIKTHKTRQQALAGYKRIKAFHEGKRDKYPFYIILSSLATTCFIAACIIAIAILVMAPVFENAVMWSAVALVVLMLGVVFLAVIYETARQLERFDEYTKEFEQRFGPLDG